MNLYQIFKDGEPITGALSYEEGMRKLASFKRADGENATAYTLEMWMPNRAKAAEEASELEGLATIEGSLEDGELTNHEQRSNAATYWEMELGGLATTGADDVVKVAFRTKYTDTKWLRLTPEQYEKLEAFLLSIEGAEPTPERFSKYAAVQGSIKAGLMTGDFIACTGNSETGEFRITTTGEPFTVRLTRNADRSITTTKIEG